MLTFFGAIKHRCDFLKELIIGLFLCSLITCQGTHGDCFSRFCFDMFVVVTGESSDREEMVTLQALSEEDR